MSRLFGYMIAVLLLLGSLAAAGYMISQRPEPARREPPSQIPFAVTEPVEAGAGAIPVYGAGTVRPRAQIDISAELSGRVVWVEPALQSGGRVQAGQALFRLDDAEYLNQLARARSDVAIQEVELLKVEEGARVARDEYAQFLRRRGDDEPTVEAGPLALWEPQLEAARATLERSRVAVADAELALSRTEVRAPFDGVVLTEALESGQFVTAGQSVAELYASDAVEVVVPLSDADSSLVPGLWEMRAGVANRQVSVRVVGDFGAARYAWEGYVDRVEGALDAQTRTLDVIVRVPDPLGGGLLQEGIDAGAATGGRPPLLVGKFVEVEIRGVTPDEYFRVRRPALRPGNEVWAVSEGAVTIVPVRVLQRSDDNVYVTGALEPGQAVVVDGIEIATEGMRVQTSPLAAP